VFSFGDDFTSLEHASISGGLEHSRKNNRHKTLTNGSLLLFRLSNDNGCSTLKVLVGNKLVGLCVGKISFSWPRGGSQYSCRLFIINPPLFQKGILLLLFRNSKNMALPSLVILNQSLMSRRGEVGSTPIYGLYRDDPLDMVWVFKFLVFIDRSHRQILNRVGYLSISTWQIALFKTVSYKCSYPLSLHILKWAPPPSLPKKTTHM